VSEVRGLLTVTCHTDFEPLFTRIIDLDFHAAVGTNSLHVGHPHHLHPQMPQYSVLPTRCYFKQALILTDTEPDLFSKMRSFIASALYKFECYVTR
jgi:hypothetical protein